MERLSRPRFFYGWIVAACAFGVMFTAYGVQYAFGVFFPAILKEFGWTRASLSGAFSLYTLVYTGCGFLSGRLTDYWGPRRVVALGGLMLGSGLMLLSLTHNRWQLYLFYGLIAGLGMSTAYIPCNATVVKWFVRRRGTALGLVGSGASLGIFAIPPLAALLISRYGWHLSYLLFGAATLVLLNIMARFMYRDPEELGLHPDGGSQPINPLKPMVGGKTPGPRAVEMDVSDAIRTPAFWCLTASMVAALFTIPIPYVHLVSHAQDLGLPPMVASTFISMIGASALVGNLSLGPASDRIGRKATLGICLFLAVLAFLGFGKAQTASGLYAAAAAFGLYYGAAAISFPAIVGDFFGREHAGALTGIIFALGGPAVALGPVVAGWIYDRTGGYYLAFLLSAVVSAAALVILVFARAPEKHPAVS